MLNNPGLTIATVAALFAVAEAGRRTLVGLWRFAMAAKRLMEMPEAFRIHAEDDAAFQEYIITSLDGMGPIRFESEDL